MNNNAYPGMEALEKVAYGAGEKMLKAYLSPNQTERKADNTLVTEVDREVNGMVIDWITNSDNYRHLSVIGEEGSRSRLSEQSNVVAILDPLDGTTRYRLGLRDWTFSMSVGEENDNGEITPLAAVIYDPLGKRMWLAEKGRGCFRNGKQVHVSEEKLENSWISLMWWKDSVGNFDAVRPQVDNSGAHWMNNVAVAICGGLIASGDAEGDILIASVFGGRHAWETPTMHLMVEEAKGFVTDVWGNRFIYRLKEGDFSQLEDIEGHVMSNSPETQDKLLTMIARANPEHQSFAASEP